MVRVVVPVIRLTTVVIVRREQASKCGLLSNSSIWCEAQNSSDKKCSPGGHDERLIDKRQVLAPDQALNAYYADRFYRQADQCRCTARNEGDVTAAENLLLRSTGVLLDAVLNF